ncbi:MGH1-like glycoside hydrolase domain-containing protein [Deinococcus sp.]|uniref:MGH1-like glycoside hydrolase domain-containing protein n=1 Tax=Deinococcus sp. TaxID=47478 RepID=UPI003CC6034E
MSQPSQPSPQTAEHQRLEQDRTGQRAWKRWGPYLAERAWGTVREDYSASGDAWNALPHDHARSRAYRWNEDGLLGVSDDGGRLCLALALWNGQDPILKERLYGLSGNEGNHGEDVKEYYAYLDSTPTHSYMKALYRYPQRAFPYQALLDGNRGRGKDVGEYELIDTGIFDDNRYWDIEIEYAKAAPDDLLMRVTAHNRGPQSAQLHLLPTLWFRNTWSWHPASETDSPARPRIRPDGAGRLRADHPELGARWLAFDPGSGEALLCENETNRARLYGLPNPSQTAKDGFHEYLIGGRQQAVRRDEGSKAALHVLLSVPAGESRSVQVRLSDQGLADPLADFSAVLDARKTEADAFYAALQPAALSADERNVQRQAFAGMLWSKQFYSYDVEQWLRGDPAGPAPPDERKAGRNRDWVTLHTSDVLSMPDKWEYPWFAAWDLAFHAVPLAQIDPEFAKRQLELLTREWYQHPNGQIPAYEWSFSDVNPPVHAWAALRVYQIEKKHHGRSDRAFLERLFHKLLLNFTWWVNRKDAEGRNVFQGGFLGLDNISVFDRSAPLPGGGHLEQADGTAWMGMFCLNMLKIALELAGDNSAYQDIASKFFEHFLHIARALNHLGDRLGEDSMSLWDEQDEFYYDQLRAPNGGCTRLRVRSMVGLIPLLAVETLEPADLARLPVFGARVEWLLGQRPDLANLVSRWAEPGVGNRHLLALARGHRMKRVLARMLDEGEFLSSGGVRSLSRHHDAFPYEIATEGNVNRIEYQPAESRSGLFGGNSNWRGPIWFPINYLLIESLQRFHHYYGDDFRVECPTGSGQKLTLGQTADELSRRLINLFLNDASGRRPVFGEVERFQTDPHWHDQIPFHEYFHGDTGAGLGAAHQTGWTGLVAKLLQQQGGRRGREQAAPPGSAVKDIAAES